MPTDRSELAYSYAPLVKRVSPAVVNIYTTTTARVQRRLPFPFPGMPLPPQAGERVQNSLGSGVIVRPDGLIVTNAHVVKGADEIRVVLADRREFEAKLLTQDERYDLALLRIDTSGEKFPFLEMRDSDSVEVGDIVLAIGNPVRPQPDRDQRHHLGAWRARRAASTIPTSSSRPTPPSIRAIPAARWSASTAG